MVARFRVKIKNRSGLHARPAAIFVSACRKYKSSIVIHKENRSADAKNILQVLSLGIDQGDEIDIVIEGEDENEASKDIKHLLEKHLPEIDR